MYSLHEYYALKHCEQMLRQAETSKPPQHFFHQVATVPPTPRRRRRRRIVRFRLFRLMFRFEVGHAV
jgi:hypothetical protein